MAGASFSSSKFIEFNKRPTRRSGIHPLGRHGDVEPVRADEGQEWEPESLQKAVFVPGREPALRATGPGNVGIIS
jgi:hypothetical protein